MLYLNHHKTNLPKGASSHGKYNTRYEVSVLEAFWSWLEAQNPVKNSRLDKAVAYISKHRVFLDTYLEDGRCSLHNNLNIYKYRTYILGQRPNNNWSDEQLETIAPWNEAVIDVCKNN